MASRHRLQACCAVASNPRDRHLVAVPLDEEVDGIERPGRVRIDLSEGGGVDEPEAIVRDLGDADLHCVARLKRLWTDKCR
jgi:hypothetical protein